MRRQLCCAAAATAASTPIKRLSLSMRGWIISPACTFSTSAISPRVLGLAEGVLKGDRLSLSRAITLIESSKESHRQEAEALLDHVVRERSRKVKTYRRPNSNTAMASSSDSRSSSSSSGSTSGSLRKGTRPLRIGIAGPPGAGKSTFIESLGMYLLDSKGLRVAVIAVDPSSSRSGGSILGDKTRMYELSKDPRAFVRACPTSGVLGGVARYTNDVVLLCQAAAFDVVFIETVGLGQSEIMIDQTSDMLLLLVPPGGGDELQGVKKGIMEVADVVVVNKADGHLLTAAQHTAAEYKHALCFQRRKWEPWTPTVTMCSALRREKIAKVWEEVSRCSDVLDKTGFLRLKRRDQGRHWMWSSLEDLLVRKVRGSGAVERKAVRMEEELADGTLTPRSAAEMLLGAFLEEQRTTEVARKK